MSNYDDKAEVTREFYRRQGEVRERERIIKVLEGLATHKDCQIGEHHEDYVWNNPLGIIEVLIEWDKEPIALIKGETMSELPNYHCPECDDLDCLHCYCVEPTECESCKEFIKGEKMNAPIQIITSVEQQKEVYARLDEQGRKNWAKVFEAVNLFTKEELAFIKGENK